MTIHALRTDGQTDRQTDRQTIAQPLGTKLLLFRTARSRSVKHIGRF